MPCEPASASSRIVARAPRCTLRSTGASRRPSSVRSTALGSSANELLAGEYAEAREDDFVDSILIARAAPRPNPSKSDNGPVDRVQKVGLIKQGRDLAG